jgi:hypothetical protein
MVLDREWLLGVARQEREALGRTIQYTRPDAWEHPSPWRGRPLADVLSHLVLDGSGSGPASSPNPSTGAAATVSVGNRYNHASRAACVRDLLSTAVYAHR